MASLTNPALDSILDFAGKVGLVVIIHNDIDMPFAKKGIDPVYLKQMKDLLRRHPTTTIIWAHVGLGRVVQPVQYATEESSQRSSSQLEIVEEMLKDPALKNLYFDISWDEVAKYVVATPKSIQNTASVINRFPDRFLFGTDVVAPPNQPFYLAIYYMYQPLWNALNKESSEKLRKGNYERIFNEARVKVRTWEKANARQ